VHASVVEYRQTTQILLVVLHVAGRYFGHHRQQQDRPIGPQWCREVDTAELTVRQPHNQCTASRVCAHSTQNPTQGPSFNQSGEGHAPHTQTIIKTQSLNPAMCVRLSVQRCDGLDF
jgi:hypothetical protein